MGQCVTTITKVEKKRLFTQFKTTDDGKDLWSPQTEKEIPVITFDQNGHADLNKYEQDNEKYIKELKDLLLKRFEESAYTCSEKYVGEIIRFPVADGYAEYMVASMNPLELVHLPLGDAWNFEYVHLLTIKEVTERLVSEKKMKELFK